MTGRTTFFAPGTPEVHLYDQYATALGHTARLPPAPLVTLEELAERYDGFFLDSYGVLNRGDELIPHAAEGVAFLHARGKTVRVLTNNSNLSEEDNRRTLRKIGIPLEAGEVICSGSLLARHYALEPRPERVYYLGTDSGTTYLDDAGLVATEDPAETDTVVLASSRGYRMRRIAVARAILSKPGSHLVVLNPDAVAPRPRGVMARVSGITARSLARDTGCRTTLLGKPFPDIYKLALERTGLKAENCVALGDTLATDILGGRSAGIDCALVLTGVTRLAEAHALADRDRIWPTYHLADLRVGAASKGNRTP